MPPCFKNTSEIKKNKKRKYLCTYVITYPWEININFEKFRIWHNSKYIISHLVQEVLKPAFGRFKYSIGRWGDKIGKLILNSLWNWTNTFTTLTWQTYEMDDDVGSMKLCSFHINDGLKFSAGIMRPPERGEYSVIGEQRPTQLPHNLQSNEWSIIMTLAMFNMQHFQQCCILNNVAHLIMLHNQRCWFGIIIGIYTYYTLYLSCENI